MGKKQLREDKLRTICEKIAKINYPTLVSEFPTEHQEKIKVDEIHSGDLSIEGRLAKYNSISPITEVEKKDIESVIRDLKNSYLFERKDYERLNIFNKKVNQLLQKTSPSGAGLNDWIIHFIDGPSNLAKGCWLDIVQLFNEMKDSDNWNSFVSKSKIEAPFLGPSHIAHFRYWYSLAKNCQDKNTKPIYYKQWKTTALWFFGIEKNDYDGFCVHYNSLTNLGTPKLLHFSCYYSLLLLKLKSDPEFLQIISEENEKKQIENLIFVDKKEDNDDSDDLNEDSVLSNEFKFYQWIDANKDYAENSKILCKSRIKNISKLSIANKLGNIFEWNFDEFKTKQNELRVLPEFVANSSTKGGDGWYSASLNKFQEYLYSKENNSLELIERDFRVWLTKKLPSSVASYLGGKTFVNTISEKIGLGNFYLWTLNDFSKNKELLFNDSDFTEKNTKGKAAYSNLIYRFGDFLNERVSGETDTNEDIIIPVKKYDDYRWYWSTLRPVLDLNRLDIIFGVTKVIGEIGGKVANSKAFKDKLKQLEKDLKIDDKRLSKHDTDLSRNIIASVREYWQGPGILNTDNTLTDFGLSIANGTLSYDEFVLELVNNFNLPNPNLPQRYSPEVIKNWEINNLRIAPFKIIIQILTELFYKFDFGTQSYLSVDELIDIVIPISADTPSDIKKYCNAIIKSRNGELDLSKWPKYMTFGQDEGRLPKEFLIVLKYWGLLEEVQLKGNEESARYYLTNKARSMFVAQNNNFGREISLPSSQNPCSSPLVNPVNKIYFGAPGTGKSFKIAKMLKGNVCEKFKYRITFHPEYDHASFLGGYKPASDTDGNIKYEFVPQIFTNIFVEACNDSKSQFYLIIEEINRGNCAEIFGDLFQLLDREDDYGISPTKELKEYLNNNITNLNSKFWDLSEEESKRKMLLPDNITVLATMNTSDQSLMPMDSAFKRRWEWEYVPIIYGEKDPETNLVNRSYDYKVQLGTETFSWIKFIETVNHKISKTESLGMDKCLGNYFVKVKDNEILISEDTFINKVLFYLWNDVFKDENDEDGLSIFKGMTFMDFFPKETARQNIKKILEELDKYRADENKKDSKKMIGKIFEALEPIKTDEIKLNSELDPKIDPDATEVEIKE